MTTPRSSLVIGVDGGGTSCRVAIADAADRIVGSATGGSANIFTDFDKAVATLRETLALAALEAAVPLDDALALPAVLGLAGVNVDGNAGRVLDQLGMGNAHVVTDAEIALEGALGPVDGMIAIIGTGSAFLRRVGGTIESVGGWGFMLGDQASGAWIGRCLLEQALLSHDGVAEKTALCETVLARFGNDPMVIVSFAQSAKPTDFASFAPDVFAFADNNDDVAKNIVERGAHYLERVVDRFGKSGLPVAMLGGLAALYVDYLSAATRQKLVVPKGSALDGAIALALRFQR